MKPPDDHSNQKKHIWLATGIGCFVTMFLLVFRPFGLVWSSWSDPVFWFILGLAPFNTLLILALDALMALLQKRWMLLRRPYLNLVLTVTLVILGNVLYQVALQDGLPLSRVLAITGHVALIAFFPTLFIVLYFHRNKQHVPQQDQTTPKLFTLSDENNRETLSIPCPDLLYINSDRNYVLVHTRSAAQPYLLRISLKALEKQLAGTAVVRCHRSYLVNTGEIVHHRKLARRSKLSLRNSTVTIPVSGSYIEHIEHLVTRESGSVA